MAVRSSEKGGSGLCLRSAAWFVLCSHWGRPAMGYPDSRFHVVYLGTGDLKFSLELIQNLNPLGGNIGRPPIPTM